MKVVIYTDGACRGNPGRGGWGATMSYGDKTRDLRGFEDNTTNNRMELTAAVEALGALSRHCEVDLYTDSQYVQKGISTWMQDWKKRKWKTASKKPVKNVDLWLQLDELAGKHNVQWHWVKGHDGNPGNERADELANIAIDEAIRQFSHTDPE